MSFVEILKEYIDLKVFCSNNPMDYVIDGGANKILALKENHKKLKAIENQLLKYDMDLNAINNTLITLTTNDVEPYDIENYSLPMEFQEQPDRAKILLEKLSDIELNARKLMEFVIEKYKIKSYDGFLCNYHIELAKSLNITFEDKNEKK